MLGIAALITYALGRSCKHLAALAARSSIDLVYLRELSYLAGVLGGLALLYTQVKLVTSHRPIYKLVGPAIPPWTYVLTVVGIAVLFWALRALSRERLRATRHEPIFSDLAHTNARVRRLRQLPVSVFMQSVVLTLPDVLLLLASFHTLALLLYKIAIFP